MQYDGNAPRSNAALWWWLALVSAGFFLISLSGDVERVTSPDVFGLHVVLRKGYSIVAFAIVGFLISSLRRSKFWDVFPVALLLALYSGCIEVAQYAVGSKEGLYWNLIDVECGFVGGFIGCAVYVWFAKVRARRSAAQAERLVAEQRRNEMAGRKRDREHGRTVSDDFKPA